ncbi:hypothetical protein XENOCAPTIV_022871 [Xenoophorus captivus]|uniref:Secreted protein n=1 Tax=Xenoophorus captivus TaxID=1517983 RepID=A0ABV0S2U1_9TELE
MYNQSFKLAGTLCLCLYCVGAKEAMCLGFGSVIASQSKLIHEEMSILREKSVLQSKSYTTTRFRCRGITYSLSTSPCYSFSSLFNLKCVGAANSPRLHV